MLVCTLLDDRLATVSLPCPVLSLGSMDQCSKDRNAFQQHYFGLCGNVLPQLLLASLLSSAPLSCGCWTTWHFCNVHVSCNVCLLNTGSSWSSMTLVVLRREQTHPKPFGPPVPFASLFLQDNKSHQITIRHIEDTENLSWQSHKL